jgi:hypothetical protein
MVDRFASSSGVAAEATRKFLPEVLPRGMFAVLRVDFAGDPH